MPTSADPCDVLVIGAGPTGLVLALWLRRMGVRVRIIDKATEPGTTSRALVVHARTLELYRQLGLADEVVERGQRFTALNLWVRGEPVAHVPFGDIGVGLSPYPEMWIFPQDQHERLLIDVLRREGVEVERGTELVGFEERADGVHARLKGVDGAESDGEAAYLVGCDGAHSTVRRALGMEFPGGTYERVFYVADVEIHGPPDTHELHLALDDTDFLAVFPLKGAHAARLIGTVRHEAEPKRGLTWDDVSKNAVERLRVTVDRVNWFSTYHVHHRVAGHFRRGRVFLAGDAAHIHSPVGGQGMNTGIGDAVNLAWKLASALSGRTGTKILDSYEPERRAFAELLVATTDRVFTFVTQDGPLARWGRFGLTPRVVPALMKRSSVRRFMFRTVSQTRVSYHGAGWSEGRAGSVRGGDRLPWVPAARGAEDDNFLPLTSLDWQLHVHGEARAALAPCAARRGIPLHTFAWSERAAGAGLARDAAYLVRPDGYVAFADPTARPERLERYLDTLDFVTAPSA